jgi:hypothetical protein
MGMRTTPILALALLSAAVGTAQDVARLDSQQQPLVGDFQAGKGRARLIAILSPT